MIWPIIPTSVDFYYNFQTDNESFTFKLSAESFTFKL